MHLCSPEFYHESFWIFHTFLSSPQSNFNRKSPKNFEAQSSSVWFLGEECKLEVSGLKKKLEGGWGGGRSASPSDTGDFAAHDTFLLLVVGGVAPVCSHVPASLSQVWRWRCAPVLVSTSEQSPENVPIVQRRCLLVATLQHPVVLLLLYVLMSPHLPMSITRRYAHAPLSFSLSNNSPPRSNNPPPFKLPPLPPCCCLVGGGSGPHGSKKRTFPPPLFKQPPNPYPIGAVCHLINHQVLKIERWISWSWKTEVLHSWTSWLP